MPNRPRSHQLEDESIQKFMQLLPSQWVCRRKDKDYGVDLEVELFDDSGASTGLMFYAQIKATDDLRKEKSVVLLVDRLEYLSSLDIPSMIVRYCSKTDSIHWSWLPKILATHRKPSTKNVKVNFPDESIWRDTTQGEILRTLEVYRIVRVRSRSFPFGIQFSCNDLSSSDAFEIDYAVNKLLEHSSQMVRSSDLRVCLPVEVAFTEKLMTVRVDTIAKIDVGLKELDRSEITSKLAYTLVYIALNHGFSAQANDLIAVINSLELTIENRVVAVSVAIGALRSSLNAAGIAERCGLHTVQDEPYLAYLNALLSKQVPDEVRIPSMRRFYLKAIEAHETKTRESRSVLHYSLANFEQQTGRYSVAIRNYNLARKLNEGYLDQDYYLCELGATLFFSGHFRCSAAAYLEALRLRKTAQVAICTADAMIYSRQFEVAREILLRVGAGLDADDFELAEASVKIWLIDSLIYLQSTEGFDLACATDRYKYWSDLTEKSFRGNRLDVALVCCLMLGFIAEHDVGVWISAVSLSASSGQTELASAVFSCAIWRCGFEVYAGVRENLVKLGATEDVLTEFDSVAKHLEEVRPSKVKKQATMRLGPNSRNDEVPKA